MGYYMVSIDYLKTKVNILKKQLKDEIRKETAMEILELLYSQMPKTQIVVEIEKRYGVKITDIGGNKND